MFQYMLLLRGATQKRHCSRREQRFNTCSSCEEQPPRGCRDDSASRFNTCSSCEEQLKPFVKRLFSKVSIHAPLARSNMKMAETMVDPYVSIHAPLARSNDAPVRSPGLRRGFNTCSSCEEQPESGLRFAGSTVSIHAPLARSNLHVPHDDAEREVSIHAPLARSNPLSMMALKRDYVFQYMLLLRGATGSSLPDQTGGRFQYMLLLRGATFLAGAGKCPFRFNTCSSCEEQPAHADNVAARINVSIHAPLARSNWHVRPCHGKSNGFNTCSSCEEQLS